MKVKRLADIEEKPPEIWQTHSPIFSNQEKARKIALGADACDHCYFSVRKGDWICWAPWSDAYMEEYFIDPCFEGVYKKLTGYSAPALAMYEAKHQKGKTK